MLCCANNAVGQIKAIDILKSNPQPCHKHNKQVKFICKSCLQQSLLCEECILDHQNHDWVSLPTFLNDDVLNLFQTGKSKSGQVVEQYVDQIATSLYEFQKRIQQKLRRLIASIYVDLQKLKAKFPTSGGYQISGRNLSQKNIKQVISILNNQKFVFDTSRIQKLYREIIIATEQNINQLFDQVEKTLCGHEWDLLDQMSINKIQNRFLSVYRKLPPNRKFLFSMTEKSKSINLTNNKLTAVYVNECKLRIYQVPKNPAALLDKYFRQQQHKVGFKITKLQTHAYFFNMSVVYIGVCNSTFADGFGYTDLAKPSKGAYMISSAGRCYHSKLPEYDDKGISFGFGAGDIIILDVNIANKTVRFEKKTGKIPFGKYLQMPLSLDQKFIFQLKPFVMFSHEVGAEVTILNQTQLILELDGKQLYPVKTN